MSNQAPDDIRELVFILERVDGLNQIEGMSKHVEASGVDHVGLDHHTLKALLFLAREGAHARQFPVRIRFGT